VGQSDAITVIQQGLITILTVAAPILVVGLVVGLVVSVIQAATQINEQSLGFILKIVAIFLIIILCGPWMLTQLMDFTKIIYDYMGAA